MDDIIRLALQIQHLFLLSFGNVLFYMCIQQNELAMAILTILLTLSWFYTSIEQGVYR
jgi:hypothetical protein